MISFLLCLSILSANISTLKEQFEREYTHKFPRFYDLDQ